MLAEGRRVTCRTKKARAKDGKGHGEMFGSRRCDNYLDFGGGFMHVFILKYQTVYFQFVIYLNYILMKLLQ
jgi:hypothetical protein